MTRKQGAAFRRGGRPEEARRMRLNRRAMAERDLESAELKAPKVDPPFGFVCPRPDKRHELRRETVDAALANLARKGFVGVEVYWCPCGRGWCVGRHTPHSVGLDAPPGIR